MEIKCMVWNMITPTTTFRIIIINKNINAANEPKKQPFIGNGERGRRKNMFFYEHDSILDSFSYLLQ